MHLFFLTLAAVCVSQNAHAAGPLEIGTGTVELGGTATANLAIGNGNTSSWIQVAPSAGYFIADAVELLGGVNLTIAEGTSGAGFNLGARWVGQGSVRPYAGGTFGWGQTQYLDLFAVDSTAVTAMGGGLVPLGPKVAVDVGARMVFLPDFDAVQIPIGYLGVSGFFP